MKDAEIERLRNQLGLLQRRLRQEALPTTGVSRSATRVLAVVTRSTEAPQPREVAERLEMTSSNVAAALRELEAADLVTRAKDPLDGRKARIVVTERGQAVVTRSRRERDSWLGRAIAELLDEREQQVLSAAGELIERLAAYELPRTQ